MRRLLVGINRTRVVKRCQQPIPGVDQGVTYLRRVQDVVTPESDLGQSAHQLVGRLPLKVTSKSETPGEAITPLSDLLHQIRI